MALIDYFEHLNNLSRFSNHVCYTRVPGAFGIIFKSAMYLFAYVYVAFSSFGGFDLAYRLLAIDLDSASMLLF